MNCVSSVHIMFWNVSAPKISDAIKHHSRLEFLAHSVNKISSVNFEGLFPASAHQPMSATSDVKQGHMIEAKLYHARPTFGFITAKANILLP